MMPWVSFTVPSGPASTAPGESSTLPEGRTGGTIPRVFPSVKEISEYRKQCVDNLWEEVKRFENPHAYYVDLSQDLWDLRQELLKRGNK